MSAASCVGVMTLGLPSAPTVCTTVFVSPAAPALVGARGRRWPSAAADDADDAVGDGAALLAGLAGLDDATDAVPGSRTFSVGGAAGERPPSGSALVVSLIVVTGLGATGCLILITGLGGDTGAGAAASGAAGEGAGAAEAVAWENWALAAAMWSTAA